MSDILFAAVMWMGALFIMLGGVIFFTLGLLLMVTVWEQAFAGK